MGDERRRNILLITTDQHRFDAVGANGNPLIQTPNLDRLAAEGINFVNHVSSCPLCTPARASILTGRYPLSHGAWDVGVTLPEETCGLADWLTGIGYRCGLFGKAHFEPQMSGFPEGRDRSAPYYGFGETAITEDHQVGEYLDWVRGNHPEYWEVVRRNTHDGFPPPPDLANGRVPDCTVSGIPPHVHQTAWIERKTRSFIEKSAAEEMPFFAWCSFVDPHHPWNPIERYASLYDPTQLPPPQREAGFLDSRHAGAEWYRRLQRVPDAEYRRICAAYYAMITHVDSAVGEILSFLRERDLLETTLVLFTSDHGEYNGDHGLLRKGSSLYEAILRVPMIVRVPGVERGAVASPAARSDTTGGIAAGGRTVCGSTQHEDIAPTLLEWCGANVPETIQGRSFMGVLNGEEDTARRFAYLYHPASNGIHGIRGGRWKLVHYPEDAGWVLTDLQEDPLETSNAFAGAEGEEAVGELKDGLLDWLLCARPHLPPKRYPW